MTSNRKKSGHPSYKKPPVVEVVAGVQFKTIDKFLAAHLGFLWDCIGRGQFPDCQEQMPLANGDEINKVILLTRPDLPRVWFVGDSDSSIVQFQRDRFLYNWRKRDKDYPRYDSVIENFYSNYKKVSDCLVSLRLDEPEPEKLELTYINFVPVADFGGCGSIGKILKDCNWGKHNFLPSPTKFSLYWQFNIPDNNALLNAHAAVVQHAESGDEILRIEMTAQGQAPSVNIQECQEWYDSSHAAIVKGFTDLTTDDAHKIWERYE